MEADPARISIPMAHGKRGNPIVIPAHLRGRLLADSRSPGCKTFTRAHPQHVQFHELKAVGFYTDVDTPEGIQRHMRLNNLRKRDENAQTDYDLLSQKNSAHS